MYSGQKEFKDRKDAGEQLGKLLEKGYKNRNVLVLGIPRGGVEVAYYVAEAINGELSVLVSKKLPLPGQEELAFGAMSEDGSIFLTPLGHRLDDETVEATIRVQLKEINRRMIEYRKGKPLPNFENREIILVDDGIATGATLVPALRLCKENNAKKIIVAAPVSGQKFVPEIKELADEIIIAEKPENFSAVGQFYEDFKGLTDEQVNEVLKKFELAKER